MINWKRCGKKWSRPILRYYPRIYMEGMRKTKKTSARIANIRAEI
jgi:hypothetical protein